MPRATAFEATPTPRNTAHGFVPVLRRLPIVAVILAAGGMLATAAFDRDPVITDVPRLVPAPSAAPRVATAGDPSVPDASTVFKGRKVDIEEPAPTF